jgi:hydroxyisourate hydrolase
VKLSTHVLDTALGMPAAGISITCTRIDEDEQHHVVAQTSTNADGRTDKPLADPVTPGTYELTFAVASYFADQNVAAFYDTVAVRFRVADDGRNYHVPLLLAPWGYSTYRGS